MNLREAAQQALEALERADKISGHGNNRKTIVALRSALAEDAPETNFGNMAQVVDCYGDGNVYRGQRSRDSKAPTITVSTLEKVDPVAYVTGFSKGYAVVQPVDRCLLMPVGMALYRSPPTSQESRQVEPMAYIHETGFLVRTPGATLTPGMKLYTAPPKREPLTDEEIEDLANEFLDWNESGIAEFARAIERAHGIRGEE